MARLRASLAQIFAPFPPATFFTTTHPNKVNEPGNPLSSLERLLLGLEPTQTTPVKEPLRKGALCPQCRVDVLDYNSLLQLECPACRYVDSDGGGCT